MKKINRGDACRSPSHCVAALRANTHPSSPVFASSPVMKRNESSILSSHDILTLHLEVRT